MAVSRIEADHLIETAFDPGPGLGIALKGQVGQPDFFCAVKRGGG